MEQNLDNFHTEAAPLPSEIGDEVSLEETSSKGSGFWQFFRDVLETLILSVVLFVAINAVSARIRVDGSSMVPTLNNGEFVMVNRLAYKFGAPKHGDVVVFDYPRDPQQEYIKRIIGLPGDFISIKNGYVYVNGLQLIEPYIAAAPRSQGEWTVPEDHIFVLGDNRNNSQDSRSFGFVAFDQVIGKALFIYWPPTNWGSVVSPEIEAAISNATSYP
ncbi:MAG TPA: signal peptidase I [Chloroflexi bacterium]|nr:signal peptidase I [Chloroflexota bacterium]